jgi:DNA/RNA-binding domain of Phe-tRNA-synthetase-like protein
VGILTVENCPNLPDHPDLAAARTELVQDLKERFGGMERKKIREMPVFSAYDAFYRQFRKTYHVLLQLESVVHKDKSIFSPSSLVSVMFMAELKTGLLTAAHDRDIIKGDLKAEIAHGGESYIRINGAEQDLKAGDLYIRDQEGILSSVIYGPDQRTQIKPNTNAAVYTTYGPPGITKDQVMEQLEIMEGYIKIFAPNMERIILEVY